MPWLPFYAKTSDLPLLYNILTSEADLALLVPVEGDLWRATLDFALGQDDRFSLWHVPGGPLPLMPYNVAEAVG